MKVALVAPSFRSEHGRMERRINQLARGLAAGGVEVEILTQGGSQSTCALGERITLCRYPTVVGPLRFVVAPQLWERLRTTAESFDVVDVHTRHPCVALAVARLHVSRLVFTPGSSMDVFLGWPYAAAMRALVSAHALIVCHSATERDQLCRTIPETSHRTHVVPDGVDVAALRAATPFMTRGIVVLAVDRLDRGSWVRRAIAAVPSLPPEFRLVVIGDGPARDRLRGYAADLGILARVQFVGSVPDGVLAQWLRSARVVLSLGAERGSGSQVAEAGAAGAFVVASDLGINREAALRAHAPQAIYVSPRSSPLDVSDAIDEAARTPFLSSVDPEPAPPPSWDATVDSTRKLYRELLVPDVGSRPKPGGRPRRRRAVTAVPAVTNRVGGE